MSVDAKVRDVWYAVTGSAGSSRPVKAGQAEVVAS